MSKSNSNNQLDHQEIKKRRSQSKFNKDLPRYQCFCLKQYLSYPALYLHMKNKHIDYFQNAKNSKRAQPTRLIETFDAQEGFKIYKISTDSNALQHDKKDSFRMFPPFDFYRQNQGNNNFYPGMTGGAVLFPNLAYQQNYPFEGQQNNKQADGQKMLDTNDVSIEQAIELFLESIQKRSIKDKQETKLFFLIFLDCLNKNYAILNDKRTLNKSIQRYTSQYNSDCIMNILTFFEDVYLVEAFKQQQNPISFFLKNSSIMSTKKYNIVLQNFHDFLQNGHSQKEQGKQFKYEYDKDSESNQQNNQQHEAGQNSSQFVRESQQDKIAQQ